jgi:hypothetical protein
MTKKKVNKAEQPAAAPKTTELPGMKGPGVEVLVIAEIDAAVDTYEKKKAKRCEVSPAEIAAKRELRDLLIQNREKLHVDKETGKRFYRREGVDYIIEETIKRHAVLSDNEEPSVQEVL